jgi:hypothetical protein
MDSLTVRTRFNGYGAILLVVVAAVPGLWSHISREHTLDESAGE